MHRHSLFLSVRPSNFHSVNYRERLMARPFHCYGRPWRWYRFPQTGRRNRWPQNAPHWSSENRRPWRLSYRPPLTGKGGREMEMVVIRKEGMRYIHVTKTEASASTMNYIFILSKHDRSMEPVPEVREWPADINPGHLWLTRVYKQPWKSLRTWLLHCRLFSLQPTHH